MRLGFFGPIDEQIHPAKITHRRKLSPYCSKTRQESTPVKCELYKKPELLNQLNDLMGDLQSFCAQTCSSINYQPVSRAFKLGKNKAVEYSGFNGYIKNVDGTD
jgi:hypothetical protein